MDQLARKTLCLYRKKPSVRHGHSQNMSAALCLYCGHILLFAENYVPEEDVIEYDLDKEWTV